MSSDTTPFFAGGMIADPRYFVGYREQLDTITVRAVSAQPTSINIVGEKRIGKSSLLYHFCQTYEQRIESRGENPRNYLAVYFSLQQAIVRTKLSRDDSIIIKLVEIGMGFNQSWLKT